MGGTEESLLYCINSNNIFLLGTRTSFFQKETEAFINY
jgi:hypothetical protein